MTRLRPAPALSGLALLAAAVTLGGCISLFPKTPPAQLYRFDAAPPPSAATAATAQRIGIVFPPVSMPRAAAGDRLLTSTGPETAYIAVVRWVAPAAVLFGESTERAFAARSARVRLLGRSEIAGGQGFLRLEVREFEARYPAPEAVPTVRIVMAATLTHRSGAYAADRTFTAEAPASENGVRAIVDAYDRAMEQVTGQLLAWTDANAELAAQDVPALNPRSGLPGLTTRSTTVRETRSTSGSSIETRPSRP